MSNMNQLLAGQPAPGAQAPQVAEAGNLTIMKMPNGKIVVIPKQMGMGAVQGQPGVPPQAPPQMAPPQSAAPLAAPNPQNPMNPPQAAPPPVQPPMQPPQDPMNPVTTHVPQSNMGDFHKHVASFFERLNNKGAS